MDKEIEYSITEVTAYPDRARVTCEGSLKVDKGYQTVIFNELPLTMDVDSVRFGGKGSGRIQIVSVDVVRKHYEQSPSVRVIELENRIDSLRNEVQGLADRGAGLEVQAEHLHGMRMETREYAKGLARGQTSVADQDRLMQFLADQDQRVREEKRSVEIEKQVGERQIEKLQRELDEIQNMRPRQRFQVRVDLESDETADFQPRLTYVVRSAGWQPAYDVRLSSHDGLSSLSFTTMAQVSQRTGQEWSGVRLLVSTARPALNQRIPELNPWYLDEYRPPQPRPMMKRSAALDSTIAVGALAPASLNALEMAGEAYQEAEVVQAEVGDSGTVATYAVPGRADIPSDGSPHKLVLGSFDVDPELDYVAVPRHTSAVYRRATVSNVSGGPLLEGAAMLFVDNDFIGKTKMKYTPISGEFELLLGVEEQIRVERELTKREVDKRLLRENRIIRYAYELILENLTKATVAVEVQDQIPVSKHEQIKVKLDQISPEPHKRSDLNLLEWNLELQPQEKKNIVYEFVVEHPRSLEVSGLVE